ncbi:MAG: PQQ-dependent dehydrogenase, methanol/ethanol family [Gammaproteobacteria bacterium]|nr:PQQ-dependent dehydrogenase, methanol/ethanol family [Gammaproteobacteria bacterium]MDH3480185.1 PQQ-dependent dehydrogenase, methanol/ethanol family [Gammaproteobacteria bacterium]
MSCPKNVSAITIAAFLLALSACSQKSGDSSGDSRDKAAAGTSVSETNVTAAAIINADDTPGEWLSHGRTYSEQRYSPLAGVTPENIEELGLAWAFDFGVSRGIEATPIVADGVMYVTSSWNMVNALNAKTGDVIWRYDPQVDRSRAAVMCCDIVNRGVAIFGNKIYTGTIDGRLVAIDAKTGQAAWDVNTIDKYQPYSITGAPRVVKGKVIIGNGGAEFGVRGYVSAYDADTGKMLWRFHTVPGNPENGFENEAMKMAAETWTGEWWTIGGGGTVWDSMAYDAELDLLYIGVGNGSPWNQNLRSPDGGDNLFLSSIVALRPDTGEYVWHYQTTPGETWDYTATQHMILAELEIAGATRKVIMQAPKNGFFYVIDRETGEFLSANNYVPVNWATHVDPDTGRPVEVADARWPGKQPYLQLPGPFGGHNWHPMSFSPDTGLVYIPAHEVPFAYSDDPEYLAKPGAWNTGVDFLPASLPSDEAAIEAVKAMLKGRLLAWDPVKQEAAWAFEHKGPWNGGVLSTAGGLVFQGTADAHFAAYDATNGEQLWTFFGQTGIVAAPVSYEIDGEQYVAVASGWGGAYVLAYGGVVPTGSEAGVGRVLAFKLGANETLPGISAIPPGTAKPPAETAAPETVARGFEAYMRYCATCHGDHAVSSGLLPDLRRSPLLQAIEAWDAVVREGALSDRGMGSFGELVDAETSAAIRAYVIGQARQVVESGDMSSE